MKGCTKLVFMISLGLMGAACGVEGKPQPADCDLTAGGVVFVEGALGVDITAVVMDSKGNPLDGIEISLESNRDDDTIEPATGTTDATGTAVFSVRTSQGGTATFQASLVEETETLGSPLGVTFTLDLGLSAGDLELTYPGGTVTLEASVADSTGPVEGATLAVSSSRPNEDTIDSASQESGADGTASFVVTTMESGSATFTLEVDGLNLPDTPTVDVDFAGPTLTGQWGFPQPGGVVTAPRIGLVWIDFRQMPGTSPSRELTSVALEPVPEVWDEGTYSLPLPMHAPREDLHHPDPEDPDQPGTFVIAPYSLGIYDDLDASGGFSAGDILLAVSDEDVLLVYVEGQLPGPGEAPGITHGYQFMEMGGEGESPVIIPLEDLIDQNDLLIRSAPCPSGPLAGQVTFGNSLPVGTDTRVAVMMLDTELLFSGGGGAEVWNHGNFAELVSDDVAFARGTSVDYELLLPDPADVYPGYRDFLVSAHPDLPEFGIVAPLVYTDSNGDDAFTNQDDDLGTGDGVVGMWDLPFGYEMSLIQWLDGSPPLVFAMMMPGINQGYNLIQEPLKIAVVGVLDDNTLELEDEVEPDHTNLPFKITRETGDDEDVVLLEGDDLATGDTSGKIVTSATGGFWGLVEVGDEVVFCNQIDETQILDLDTAYNLKTH